MNESKIPEVIDEIGILDYREQSLVLYDEEPYNVIEFQEDGIALSHLFRDTLVSNRLVPYDEALTAYRTGKLTPATVVPSE